MIKLPIIDKSIHEFPSSAKKISVVPGKTLLKFLDSEGKEWTFVSIGVTSVGIASFLLFEDPYETKVSFRECTEIIKKLSDRFPDEIRLAIKKIEETKLRGEFCLLSRPETSLLIYDENQFDGIWWTASKKDSSLAYCIKDGKIGYDQYEAKYCPRFCFTIPLIMVNIIQNNDVITLKRNPKYGNVVEETSVAQETGNEQKNEVLAVDVEDKRLSDKLDNLAEPTFELADMEENRESLVEFSTSDNLYYIIDRRWRAYKIFTTTKEIKDELEKEKGDEIWIYTDGKKVYLIDCCEGLREIKEGDIEFNNDFKLVKDLRPKKVTLEIKRLYEVAEILGDSKLMDRVLNSL